MIPGYCSREKELRQLLKLGHWPDASSPDLRHHVSECRVCGELLLVSQTLRQARAQSLHLSNKKAPGLVSPGSLWWKAQLRRRNEAVKRIGRPLVGAQVFALAINLLILIGVVFWQAPRVTHWLQGLSKSGSLQLQTFWSFAVQKPDSNLYSSFGDWNSGLWMPCAAILILLSGVVVYLAADRS